jgi:hypothetical protein
MRPLPDYSRKVFVHVGLSEALSTPPNKCFWLRGETVFSAKLTRGLPGTGKACTALVYDFQDSTKNPFDSSYSKVVSGSSEAAFWNRCCSAPPRLKSGSN